jgi:hypothetical protein
MREITEKPVRYISPAAFSGFLSPGLLSLWRGASRSCCGDFSHRFFEPEKAIIVPEWAICDPAIIALATFKTGSVDGLFWAITDSEDEVFEDLDDGDEE